VPRKLKDWIDSYLEYTSNQESPEKLHLWCGFTVLSASLKRQVWLNRGYYKLFPNLYVLIVAESARIRKSSAMNIAVKLFNDSVSDGYYLKGKMTSEGLVTEMNRAKTVVKEGGRGGVMYDSHVFIHADELATLFGHDKNAASRMATLLTEGYNCDDDYNHITSGQGRKVLRNMYPVLLAATDPRNLKVLPEDAVAGLTGRMLFITARDKRKAIAWPKLTDEDNEKRELLKNDLGYIATLQGEFTVTPEAYDFFEEWYLALSNKEGGDPHVDAFYERCHDTALKVAMLISVSRSDSLVLDKSHMAGGITFIERQLPEFSRVTNWVSTNVYAQNRARLIDLLRRSGGFSSRRTALKWLKIGLDELVVLEASLHTENTIKVTKEGNDFSYKLNKEELNR